MLFNFDIGSDRTPHSEQTSNPNNTYIHNDKYIYPDISKDTKHSEIAKRANIYEWLQMRWGTTRNRFKNQGHLNNEDDPSKPVTDTIHTDKHTSS